MSSPNFAKMQEILMRELRLMHYPVAIKYFFEAAELAAFRTGKPHYSPVKPLTFCQSEIGARMEGISVLVEREKLGCANAQYVFGWKGLDESEVKSHLKYCEGADQALRVVEAKPRLKEDVLLAVAVGPLAQAVDTPDVVHLYCDNMQAYHILGDWIATQGADCFRPSMSVNSAACAGNVFTYNEQQANLFLACSGSYNSGKTERGEINVAIPGSHMQVLVERLAKRVEEKGGAGITRLGESFPGADICKNCPLIMFKKEGEPSLP